MVGGFSLTAKKDPLLSIKVKFAGLVVGAALISCAAVGVISYEIGKSGLIDASKIRLDMIAENQAATISSGMVRIEQALSDISKNNALGDAIDWQRPCSTRKHRTSGRVSRHPA